MSEKTHTGLVYKSTGSWYTVCVANKTFFECRIKGKFRIKGIKSTNPIAVGDWVDFEVNKTGGEITGLINHIHERKNYLIRKSVNLSKQVHIIAANIDLLFVLVTIDNPVTSTSFIDRLLVTAEAYGIEVVLVFNKVDTLSEDTLDEQLYLQFIYEQIGYKVLRVSAEKKQGLEALKEMMKGKVSMFTGHSGVGKSTLVNALEPSLQLKTKEISEQHQQGQHTTTFAEMYDLSFDAKIIDTPGIRGFGIVEMEPEELGDYFPEFFKRKQKCKFNNCLHREEPNCAVKEALDKDEISWTRYKSYVQIMDGEEETYRTDQYANGKNQDEE